MRMINPFSAVITVVSIILNLPVKAARAGGSPAQHVPMRRAISRVAHSAFRKHELR